MTPLNFIESIVTAIPNCHSQFHLLPFDLALFQTWLCREDVVQRRHSIATTGAKENAEIFCMPIGCTDQPKEDLGLNEISALLELEWAI